jgi:hypothetical protein
MAAAELLIPRPPEVRAALARHIREGRLLRRLYRLSLKAAEERAEERRQAETAESHAVEVG